MLVVVLYRIICSFFGCSLQVVAIVWLHVTKIKIRKMIKCIYFYMSIVINQPINLSINIGMCQACIIPMLIQDRTHYVIIMQ